MRSSLLNAVAAATLLLAASPAVAGTGTWVPVTLSNSTAMTLFAINDSSTIAGQYTDTSGAVHGFIGDFAGDNYTSFDDPDGDTQPRGMNNGNIVTGFDAGAFAPWERTPDGTLSAITHAGTDVDQLIQGITSGGKYVGDYTDSHTNLLRGYRGKDTKVQKGFHIGIKNGGFAGRAIDSAKDIGGWYYDPNTGLQRGFLLMAGTTKAIPLDFPSGQYTVVEGMNDNGYVVGQYKDASGIIHGWIYTVSDGSWTQLDAPGAASLTQVWNINNNNVITASSDAGSFVYCMSSSNCPGGAGHVSMPPVKNTPERQ